jgi:hypothetical protein
VAFQRSTLARMDRQVEALVRGFDSFVKVFDESRRFGGPSVYFHDRTLARLRSFPSPSDALQNDEFVESLYAVLTAWGMHRMGSRGARMEEFKMFRDSLRRQASAISEIDKHFHDACENSTAKLARVPTGKGSSLAEELWSVISRLKLGMSEDARIVIGSKAIHHLLPELLPPIDRRYTLRFFLGRETLGSEPEQAAFREIFPRFAQIASECEPLIDQLMKETSPSGPYMRTSPTKVIDNAIVGFGINRLRIAAEE